MKAQSATPSKKRPNLPKERGFPDGLLSAVALAGTRRIPSRGADPITSAARRVAGPAVTANGVTDSAVAHACADAVTAL